MADIVGKRAHHGLAVATIAIGLTLLAPGVAFAASGTVRAEQGALSYQAADGVAQELTVSGGGGSPVTFVASGREADLEAGEGCKVISGGEVECGADGIFEIVIDAGRESVGDVIDASGVSGLGLRIRGGDGHDRLIGGEGPDDIEGGPGADSITGGPGSDLLRGGDEDAATDRIDGGEGDDVLDGGPGIDRALYGSSRDPITITIGDGANDVDGLGGFGEDVTDTIESVSGGSGDDILVGSCFANTLAGQDGSDTILGDPDRCGVYGGDFMGGGSGDDIFRGLGGSDRVTYTANTREQPIDVSIDGKVNDADGLGGIDDIGADTEYVYGGAGDDRIDASAAEGGVSLWGRGGSDVLTGSVFDDFLRGEAESDSLDCGEGDNDMYALDEEDSSVERCETREHP